MSKHARRKGGKHIKQYQGWTPSAAGFTTEPLDEADQLVLAQVPAPPPPPIYYTPPRPGMSPLLRVVLASFAAVASLLLGAFIVLALAFALGPPAPATASDEYTRPARTQTIIVAGDQIKIKARELCPTEDSCDVDYEGRGTWKITRVTP